MYSDRFYQSLFHRIHFFDRDTPDIPVAHTLILLLYTGVVFVGPLRILISQATCHLLVTPESLV